MRETQDQSAYKDGAKLEHCRFILIWLVVF